MLWIVDFLNLLSPAISALSGIAVAAFTYALWISTEKLWTVADRQSVDMARSIKAAEDAASAALKQAEVAERTFIGLERPIMLVKEITTTLSHQSSGVAGYGGSPADGSDVGAFRAHVKLANYGRSAAIVEQFAVASLFAEQLPEVLQYQAIDWVTHEKVVPPEEEIGPATSQPIGIPINLSTRYPENVYVYGWVRYRDVYGFTFVRKFCFRAVRRDRFLTIQEHTSENSNKPRQLAHFHDPMPTSKHGD